MIRFHTAAALSLAILHPALAGDLTVRTLDKGSGTALVDAAVCLGTPADLRQLGALRSSRTGEAVFEAVPDAPLLVTVSQTGYRGERRVLDSGRPDVVTVLLVPGGGGPVCQGAAARTGGEIVEVVGFHIAGGQRATATRDVRLDFSALGDPTHWRAGESADLEGRPWREITGAPVQVRLSAGPGEKRVYLQLRKYQDLTGASLESLSTPVSDTIELLP